MKSNPFDELEVFAASWHDYLSDSNIRESYLSRHASIIV